MSAPARTRIALLAAALWWGSLSTLGFLVVPLLFAQLGNPAQAGAMAAKLFSAQTWLSLGLGALLLLLLRPAGSAGPAEAPVPAPAALLWILGGMLLALLVEFGVAPRIVSARSTGGDLRLWHGLGSAMYFGQWACALALLWGQSRSTGPRS